jgi:hypothetical protein
MKSLGSNGGGQAWTLFSGFLTINIWIYLNALSHEERRKFVCRGMTCQPDDELVQNALRRAWRRSGKYRRDYKPDIRTQNKA